LILTASPIGMEPGRERSHVPIKPCNQVALQSGLTAAVMVVARNANGLEEWILCTGITLRNSEIDATLSKILSMNDLL
jgi:hypothetical protein